MSIFGIIILWFVFMRVFGWRRRHFAHCHPHRHRLHNLHYHSQRVAPAPPQPSAFERLKRRYVDGDIGDEEYEREVDVLLRSPEGRRSVP